MHERNDYAALDWLAKERPKTRDKMATISAPVVSPELKCPSRSVDQSAAIRYGYPLVNQKAGKHHGTAGPRLKTTQKRTVTCMFIFEFFVRGWGCG